MDKKVIPISRKTKDDFLDLYYNLLADGTILHEYDKHTFPRRQNLKESLTVTDLSA